MESVLPRDVGPYRLEALLGRGGMGEVYRAHDRRLERRVAVKHVRAELADRPRAQARFLREARAAARLNHPSIVQIYDVFEDEAGDWIVMELVEGPTVAELLREGPFELARVSSIARQVAEGLAEAHARGILHRDLKAENVMLTSAGRAKVLDFGLAKPFGLPDNPASLSLPGEVLGTCRAMSPEQARGFELGPASDLFSLGTLIYEMASATSPFQGQTPTDTLTRVATHRPVPISELAVDLPEELSHLVRRLHEKAPEHRPQSAGEVAAALAEMEFALGSASSRPRLESVPGESPPTPDTELGGTIYSGSTPAAAMPKKTSKHHFAIAAAVVLAALLAVIAIPESREWLLGEPAAESPAPLETRELYRRGQAELARFDREGNLERAVATFRELIGRDPDSAPGYAGLARALWRQHRNGQRDPLLLTQAQAAAEQAVALDAYLADARISLGLVELARGHLADGISELEAALELDPTAAEARWALGQAHELGGELERAEAAYLEALELDPRSHVSYDDLGALYVRTGRLDEAETAFERSLELVPDSFLPHRNLATVYYLQGRHGEAAAQLQEALRIQPSATLYSSLGTILFSRGLYQKSAEAFEKALDLEANNYLYWANLGDAQRFIPGRESEARDAYSRALQLLERQFADEAPGPTVESRRALYLAKRGDCSEAGVAGELDAHSLYRLAVAHELCGRREEALATLEAALSAGFSPSEAEGDPELLDLRTDPGYHRLMLKLQGD